MLIHSKNSRADIRGHPVDSVQQSLSSDSTARSDLPVVGLYRFQIQSLPIHNNYSIHVVYLLVCTIQFEIFYIPPLFLLLTKHQEGPVC